MKTEEWRSVVGYEGKYNVSNLGEVWSVYHKRTLKLTTHLGYHSVLLQKDGVTSRKRVSRLVYEAFCGEIPKGMMIDHIDRNRTNNTPANLRCVDAFVNQHNRVARRTFRYGTRFGYATRIYGKLYKKSGFETEEGAFRACEELRKTQSFVV